MGRRPTSPASRSSITQRDDTTSIFLNLRVVDIDACYREWSERGAEFVTSPIDRGPEIRCYMRDPDGYMIEVVNRQASCPANWPRSGQRIAGLDPGHQRSLRAELRRQVASSQQFLGFGIFCLLSSRFPSCRCLLRVLLGIGKGFTMTTQAKRQRSSSLFSTTASTKQNRRRAPL